MPLPKILRPKFPPVPLKPLRNLIREGRQQVEKAGQEIRSIADDIRGTPREVEHTPKTPAEIEEKPSEREKSEEEGPPASLDDLKAFLEKRKVGKALSQLEKEEGDKKENLETLRKYIEGEDID